MRFNLKAICISICDKKYSNGKPVFGKIPISIRKRMYSALNNHIDDLGWKNNDIKEVVKHPNLVKILSTMSVCFYIFDKKNIERLIEIAKLAKNNQTIRKYVRSSGEKHADTIKETIKTYKLGVVQPLIVYLAEEGKNEEIKKILSQFKLPKEEKKRSKNNLTDALGWELLFKDPKNKQVVKSIFSEYLSEGIQTWNDFNMNRILI